MSALVESGPWGWPLELLLKATLVLALAGAAGVALHRSAPAVRHAVWAAALGALLLLPVAERLLPAWPVPVLGQIREPLSATISPRVSGVPEHTRVGGNVAKVPGTQARDPVGGASRARAVAAPLQAAVPTTSGRGVAWPALLLPVWAVGAAAWLLRLGLGRLALGRIARRAQPVLDAEWTALAAAEARAAGLSRVPRLLRSDRVGTPATWGITSPVLVLPAAADSWDAERRGAVLRHELAHVARVDAATQLVAGLACALYWVHPGVWLAARRLREEREHACDDRVLTSGVAADRYAGYLLELARAARSSGLPRLVSVPMVRRSHFEGRLLAILDGRRSRARLSRRLAWAGTAGTLVLVTAMGAARAVPARATGAGAASSASRLSTTVAPPSTAAYPATSASAAPAASAAADSVVELSVAARPGGVLELDLETGAAVEVSGWDRPEVHVRGELGGRSWRETRVSLVMTTNGARLRSETTGSGFMQSTSHRFVVQVPRKYDLRLSSAGGSLTVREVEGRFTGHTGGGELVFDGARGSAELSTGGGEIRVTRSGLSGSVSTGGGTVQIQGNSGDLRASSGSGPIIREDRGGGAHIERAGGAIDLPSAPNGAFVSTGGGNVRVGTSAGQVVAHTGGGTIDIGPLDGSASATTGAGDVSVTIARGTHPDHSVDVTSGYGAADIYLPADFTGRLELETAYTNNLGHATRIQSDFPVTVTETPAWDDSRGTPRKYVRGAARFGTGPSVVRVNVVNGDVRVHRAPSR